MFLNSNSVFLYKIMRVIKIKVKPQENRLDKFISRKVKTLSRSKAKKLINEGMILIDKKRVDPDYEVRKNDTITIEIIPPKTLEIKGENLPLKIIFEDKDLLVIDKESGVVVHPTTDHPSGTLVNALINHLGADFNSGGHLRPGIVHRLDKGTSGIMIVGKNAGIVEKLKTQFKFRKVKKQYILLVTKKLEPPVGQIEKSLIRHPTLRNKFTAAPGGRDAFTYYKILKYIGNKYSLVEARPRTGRTHQLRVHFSSIGHPIVGDKLYGGRPSPRLFLHASQIEFIHPGIGKKMIFSSKLPGKLSQILDKIEVEKSK